MSKVYVNVKNVFFEKRSNSAYAFILLLSIIYIVGSVGLSHSNLQHFFLPLTPINLLLTISVLLLFHKEWNRPFYTFLLICYLFGFFIEAIGVSTGIVFGGYYYGTTLGPKVMHTPLIIGINWFMLVYITGVTTSQFKTSLLSKSILGASIMVFLDFFIEPVAIALDFWSWQTDNVPVQNYVAWFIISFALLYIFHFLRFQKHNPLALPLLIIQYLFFISLCSTLHFTPL